MADNNQVPKIILPLCGVICGCIALLGSFVVVDRFYDKYTTLKLEEIRAKLELNGVDFDERVKKAEENQ